MRPTHKTQKIKLFFQTNNSWPNYLTVVILLGALNVVSNVVMSCLIIIITIEKTHTHISTTDTAWMSFVCLNSLNKKRSLYVITRFGAFVSLKMDVLDNSQSITVRKRQNKGKQAITWKLKLLTEQQILLPWKSTGRTGSMSAIIVPPSMVSERINVWHDAEGIKNTRPGSGHNTSM